MTTDVTDELAEALGHLRCGVATVPPVLLHAAIAEIERQSNNAMCLRQEVDDLRAKIERLRRALHDIAEEWAGAECGEPVHAQEAYAIGLAKRMYSLAAAAMKGTT